MEDTENFIREVVERTLPDLDFGKSVDVASHIVNVIGITSMERLTLLRDDDFCPLLRPAEARLCLRALQPQVQAEVQAQLPAVPQARVVPQGDQQGRRALRPLRDLDGNAEPVWDFRVNWKDIENGDSRIVKRCEANKKLSKSMRKVLVQRVVNQVREKVPHARRRIFVQIVADVKAKYPGTFKHELANGKVGKRSLTKKMMDTFDNKKRTPHTTRVECEAPTLKAAYGCVQWRVSLPSNQTVESQEEIRSSLADYFSTRRVSAWDWNHIQENMKLTYASQRKDINKQAELIEKLRKEQLKRKRTGRVEGEEMEVDDVTVTTAHLADLWPFLFQPLGMKAHFNILTKTDIDENVQLFIDKTLDSLHEFCKKIVVPKEKKARKLNKKLAKKIPEGDKDKVNEWKLSAVLLMLTTYFKEDWSELILMTEEDTTVDDIAVQGLPKTPILIIAGQNIFSYRRIFFAADQTVLGTAENLLDGFKLMFACYYVLNLNYAPKAQILLEFFQRIIALINPPKGHKRPAKGNVGRFSSLREHAVLTRVSQQFEEFLADKDESSPDSDE